MHYVQKYAEAAVTDCLDGFDQDVITAAGMVGISESWAMDLFRLKYSNDHTKYGSVVNGLIGYASSLCRNDRQITSAIVSKVSRAALKHWLFDKCPACMGRGHKTIDNTPMLEDECCEFCGGSGEIQWSGHDVGKDILNIIRVAESRAGGKLMKKIKERIDFNV